MPPVPAVLAAFDFEVRLLDELDEVVQQPGTHLYFLASAQRRRVRNGSGTWIEIDRRDPNEEWDFDLAFTIPGDWKVESSTPPFKSVRIETPDGVLEGDPLLWHQQVLHHVLGYGALAMSRIPMEVHYVGKTWGSNGRKTAKERLQEAHQAKGNFAAWLGNNHPTRASYAVIAKPTFFDAALDGADVVGDDVSEMPVSAELVGATEGLLIDLFAPCVTRTGESCGWCFNGKPEKAQLDALLKSGTALALAGGSASMSFQSQHNGLPQPGYIYVTTP